MERGFWVQLMNTHTHTQHAPGPWLDSGHDGKRNVIVESKLGSVAAVWDTGDAMQMRANARLIASAPDLLAALEDLLQERYVDGDESDQEFDAQGNWTCNSPASIKARAAIAKAKGTS